VSVPKTAPCTPNRPPTIQASGHPRRRTEIQHITATMTARVTVSTSATDTAVQPGPGCTTAHRVGRWDTAEPQQNRVSAAAATDPLS
jgi:hypothetical protein